MIWNKYSQFPWKVQVNEHGAPIKEIVANDGRAVCEVYEGDAADAVWNNAALLAAAPDLAIQLSHAITQMEMAAECIEQLRFDEALLHVSSMMRSKKEAIAKATGESE